MVGPHHRSGWRLVCCLQGGVSIEPSQERVGEGVDDPEADADADAEAEEEAEADGLAAAGSGRLR